MCEENTPPIVRDCRPMHQRTKPIPGAIPDDHYPQNFVVSQGRSTEAGDARRRTEARGGRALGEGSPRGRAPRETRNAVHAVDARAGARARAVDGLRRRLRRGPGIAGAGARRPVVDLPADALQTAEQAALRHAAPAPAQRRRRAPSAAPSRSRASGPLWRPRPRPRARARPRPRPPLRHRRPRPLAGLGRRRPRPHRRRRRRPRPHRLLVRLQRPQIRAGVRRARGARARARGDALRRLRRARQCRWRRRSIKSCRDLPEV